MICVSGLLFADDIVLVARSAEGLLRLLAIVKHNCDLLRLTISKQKSQIVSPDSDVEWTLYDGGDPVLTLDQVTQYKYLGTWTFGSMWRTSIQKQEQCVKTANKYRGSCIHVSHDGPDVVDVILCTWNNIAVPAILFGCEMMTFTEETIKAVERVQSGVAKYALCLPYGAPNICAQSELGMKTFRQVLYERQLGFFRRVLFLDNHRWVKIALMDHLSGEWLSPYMAYICSVRSKLGLFSVPPSEKLLKIDIMDWFLSSLNAEINSLDLPALLPVVRLDRASYVCEHKNASVLACFKMGVAGLGNREPRLGHLRQPYCPLCPTRQVNNELHLVCECPSASVVRSSTGISSFLTQCTLRGFPMNVSFKLFVNSFDCEFKPISQTSSLERGMALDALREAWLSRW